MLVYTLGLLLLGASIAAAADPAGQLAWAGLVVVADAVAIRVNDVRPHLLAARWAGAMVRGTVRATEAFAAVLASFETRTTLIGEVSAGTKHYERCPRISSRATPRAVQSA